MGDDLRPVLVTGAGGYLGSRVYGLLTGRGVPTVGTSRHGGGGLYECDLTDAGACSRLLRQTGARTVIHCAAVVPKNSADYESQRAADAGLAMVDALIAAGVEHIVFTSSMTVYGDTGPMPVREQDAQEPQGGYALGKWLAEQRLMKREGGRATILRLPGLFGPPRRGGLLYNAAAAFIKGEDFALPAAMPVWAAMHVADAAEACARAASREGAGSVIINVGYDEAMSIPSVMARLADICHSPFRVPDGVDAPVFQMNLDRMREVLGGTIGRLDTRLRELAAWVREEAESNYSGKSV